MGIMAGWSGKDNIIMPVQKYWGTIYAYMYRENVKISQVLSKDETKTITQILSFV